ncbi:MAG: hypothetical protein EOO07_25105, partial [Chitinophagaceae bacterium]
MLNFRNTAFKVLDTAKGSPVKNGIANIRLGALDYNVSRDSQEKQLGLLCSWAKDNVPYYTALQPKSYSEFPVIDKNVMKEHLDSFIDKSLNKDGLYKMVTSGSTGTPFTSYQNKAKKVRNTADTVFFASLANFTLGNKLFYFKIWNDINQKSKLSKFIE